MQADQTHLSFCARVCTAPCQTAHRAALHWHAICMPAYADSVLGRCSLRFLSMLVSWMPAGGCSLGRLLRRNTAREIASALMYLHSRDVLHGDLTGGNILLISSDTDERKFTAKVADFGLSRMLGSEAVNTGTYGTVTHMPPELLTTGESPAV